MNDSVQDNLGPLLVSEVPRAIILLLDLTPYDGTINLNSDSSHILNASSLQRIPFLDQVLFILTACQSMGHTVQVLVLYGPHCAWIDVDSVGPIVGKVIGDSDIMPDSFASVPSLDNIVNDTSAKSPEGETPEEEKYTYPQAAFFMQSILSILQNIKLTASVLKEKTDSVRAVLPPSVDIGTALSLALCAWHRIQSQFSTANSRNIGHRQESTLEFDANIEPHVILLLPECAITQQNQFTNSSWKKLMNATFCSMQEGVSFSTVLWKNKFSEANRSSRSEHFTTGSSNDLNILLALRHVAYLTHGVVVHAALDEIVPVVLESLKRSRSNIGSLNTTSTETRSDLRPACCCHGALTGVANICPQCLRVFCNNWKSSCCHVCSGK